RGGIHVAVHQHPVGLEVETGPLEALHHRRGLFRVTCGPDLEIDRGRGDLELLEEAVGHERVVMLAGVHDEMLHTLPLAEGMGDGRELDEIRAGTDDGDDSHPTPWRPRPRVSYLLNPQLALGVMNTETTIGDVTGSSHCRTKLRALL